METVIRILDMLIGSEESDLATNKAVKLLENNYEMEVLIRMLLIPTSNRNKVHKHVPYKNKISDCLRMGVKSLLLLLLTIILLWCKIFQA